jgi:hypothetical protein
VQGKLFHTIAGVWVIRLFTYLAEIVASPVMAERRAGSHSLYAARAHRQSNRKRHVGGFQLE